MEIATLILIIVSIILLGIATFFIFQIWVQSKETKINLTTIHDEFKRSLSDIETSHKKQSENIAESLKFEFERVNTTSRDLIAKLHTLENELKASSANILEKTDKNIQNSELRLIEILNNSKKLFEDNLNAQFEKTEMNIQNSELRLIEILNNSKKLFEDNLNAQFESLKRKNESNNQSFSDSFNLFRVNIEAKINEIDITLREKLITDLIQIVNKYSKELKNEQSLVLNKFEEMNIMIKNNQNNILNAITEPLQINLENND